MEKVKSVEEEIEETKAKLAELEAFFKQVEEDATKTIGGLPGRSGTVWKRRTGIPKFRHFKLEASNRFWRIWF